MRPRQTVEQYWSVWTFNDHEFAGFWEPFDEGMTSRAAAERSMKETQSKWPHEKFAIVTTVNRRVTPRAKDQSR